MNYSTLSGHALETKIQRGISGHSECHKGMGVCFITSIVRRSLWRFIIGSCQATP